MAEASFRTGDEARLLEELAAAERSPRPELLRLLLRWCDVGDAGVARLAAAIRADGFPNLGVLRLVGCGISAEGVALLGAGLADAASTTKLQSLTLDVNRVGGAALEGLLPAAAAGALDDLETLSVNECCLTELPGELLGLPRLKRLFASGNVLPCQRLFPGGKAGATKAQGERNVQAAREFFSCPVAGPAPVAGLQVESPAEVEFANASFCFACGGTFLWPVRRRHHCRSCGQSFCLAHCPDNDQGPRSCVPCQTAAVDSQRARNQRKFAVRSEEVKLSTVIGRGNFSVVYKAHYRGSAVAAKKLVGDAGDRLAQLQREAGILSTIRHRNVVGLIGACFEREKQFVLMQLAERGSLADLLASSTTPEAVKVALLADVARGMWELHSRGVLHRDLKPANVLIAADGRGMIADFGLAVIDEGTYATQQASAAGGTLGYKAPELFDGQPSSAASDVFAFGVLLCEVLTEQRPWAGLSEMEVLRRLDRGERPELPPGDDGWLAELARRCWAQEAADRPSFEAVVAEFAERARDYHVQSPQASQSEQSEQRIVDSIREAAREIKEGQRAAEVRVRGEVRLVQGVVAQQGV